MVACLLRGQFRNGWEDTESVTSQHDDVGWLTIDDAWNLSIGNELNRICATSIFGDADIFVIGGTVQRIVDNILENATKADSIEDLRFFLGGKIDTFGIAATFDVEDTSVRPDVFVITDEEAIGISRECSFSGSRETEEQSDVTVIFADIGRRVQRQLTELDGLKVMLFSGHMNKSVDINRWKETHHHREDTLFHLSSIFSTKNNHFHAFEVDFDRGGRTHALCEAVCWELASIVNDKIWFTKVGELFFGRPNEHVVLDVREMR